MLLTSQVTKSRSKESEAFAATVDEFGIRLDDLAQASGVSLNMLREFKKGNTSSFKSIWLTNLVYALLPSERAYYQAMIVIQNAAEDARIQLPLLTFDRIADGSDIYRQAFDKMVEIFSIDTVFLCRSSGLKEPNVSRWRRCKADFELDSLDKIKAVLTPEQRNFFFAIVDILYTLNLPQKQVRTTQTNLTLVA